MTRILIDLDAVLAHWGGGFDRELDTFGDAAAGIPRSADQPSWNLEEGRTSEEKLIIRHIMRLPGFYSRLEIFPGAKAAVRALLDAGYDVRIVTAPYLSNPTCASDKLDWVQRKIGNAWGARTILTNDKTLVRGDILIDDKPVITGADEPSWRRIIYGDYAYNRAVEGPRLTTWRDPSAVIDLIERTLA